jgi:hypothetical protein
VPFEPGLKSAAFSTSVVTASNALQNSMMLTLR